MIRAESSALFRFTGGIVGELISAVVLEHEAGEATAEATEAGEQGGSVMPDGTEEADDSGLAKGSSDDCSTSAASRLIYNCKKYINFTFCKKTTILHEVDKFHGFMLILGAY